MSTTDDVTIIDLETPVFTLDGPEYIEVDLAEITVGHSIHLSDLKLPEGVRLPGLGRGDSPVASATVPRGAMEEEKAAAAPAADKKGADKKDDKKGK